MQCRRLGHGKALRDGLANQGAWIARHPQFISLRNARNAGRPLTLYLGKANLYRRVEH